MFQKNEAINFIKFKSAKRPAPPFQINSNVQGMKGNKSWKVTLLDGRIVQYWSCSHKAFKGDRLGSLRRIMSDSPTNSAPSPGISNRRIQDSNLIINQFNRWSTSTASSWRARETLPTNPVRRRSSWSGLPKFSSRASSGSSQQFKLWH